MWSRRLIKRPSASSNFHGHCLEFVLQVYRAFADYNKYEVNGITLAQVRLPHSDNTINPMTAFHSFSQIPYKLQLRHHGMSSYRVDVEVTGVASFTWHPPPSRLYFRKASHLPHAVQRHYIRNRLSVVDVFNLLGRCHLFLFVLSRPESGS